LIEAAHLGEKAAGFSVIAHEIKKLAAKTNSFSVEIADTIKQFRSSISQIGGKLDVFLKLIANVQKDMSNFGVKFKEYDKSLNEAGNQVEEITQAVNEESLALRDGLQSLNEISGLLADTQNITSTLNSVHSYLEDLFDK
jgi:methyl-accepting chemotaxis protein